MKKQLRLPVLLGFFCVLAGLSGILLLGGGRSGSEAEQTRQGRVVLPSSLDSLFPPKAPQPVFLFKMFALGDALTGVISDFLSGDIKNAEANLAALKSLYEEVARLVPEWRDLYPPGPMAEVEQAFQASVQSQDPTPFMSSMEKLESVCSSCHHAYLPAAYHKYHWQDFNQVQAKDPQSGRMVGYPQLMQALNLGFTGSWIDRKQGQKESSLSRFREFKAAFQSLAETCQECHGTSERKYYVDAEAQVLVDSYGNGLAGGPEELKRAEAARTAIGNEICFKCHLVHVPAAFSKRH